VNEADLQKGITDLADNLGWLWYHALPARTEKGWATAASGSLARGFPDLVMLHLDHGIMFIEVKGDGGRLAPFQALVGDAISAAISAVADAGNSILDPSRQGAVTVRKKLRYRVYRPADYLSGVVERELRGT
jgi:hypothetical protein